MKKSTFYFALFLLAVRFLQPVSALAQSAYIGTLSDPAVSRPSVGGIFHPLGIHAWANPVQLGPDDFMSAFKRDSSYILMRHNGNGKALWTRAVTPKLNAIHIPFYLVKTADGNVVLVYDNIYDNSKLPNTASVGFLKVSPAGELLYSRRLVTNTSASISPPEATVDSGFVIGASGCIGFNLLFKFNKNGEVDWHGTYGQAGTPTGTFGSTTAIRKATPNRYKVLGRTDSGVELFDVDAGGNFIRGAWFRRADGGNMTVIPYSLVSSSANDGSMYWGTSYLDSSGNTMSHRSFLIVKVDSLNQILWSKRMLWSDSTPVSDIRLQSLPGGQVAIFTNNIVTNSNSSFNVPAIIRISPLGAVLEARRWGRSSLTQYQWEINQSALYLPYDSSALLINSCETGMELCRQKVFGSAHPDRIPGTCRNEKRSLISRDFTMERFTFTGGGPKGSWITEPVAAGVTSVNAGISYTCGDTLRYNGPTGLPAVTTEVSVVAVFPNPAFGGGHLRIQIGGYNGLAHLTVFNMEGKRFSSQQISLSAGEGLLRLPDLPFGTYLYRINWGMDSWAGGKLEIQ